MTDDAPSDPFAVHLVDCETGRSMGTFGAIGEFTRNAGEPAIVTRIGMLSALWLVGRVAACETLRTLTASRRERVR